MSDYVGFIGKVFCYRVERFKFFFCVEDNVISLKIGFFVSGVNV